MNIKQQKFLQYYIETGNAYRSALQAGYEKKYANRYGVTLLNKPYIKEELEKIKREVCAKTKLTFEYKLEVLLEGIKKYASEGKYTKAAQLIEVSNKMQGHNAATKVVNIDETTDIEVLKELTEEYLHEHAKSRH